MVDPNHPGAQNDLGTAVRDTGKFEDAVACYRRSIASDPENPLFYNNLGNAITANRAIELCPWPITTAEMPRAR